MRSVSSAPPIWADGRAAGRNALGGCKQQKVYWDFVFEGTCPASDELHAWVRRLHRSGGLRGGRGIGASRAVGKGDGKTG